MSINLKPVDSISTSARVSGLVCVVDDDETVRTSLERLFRSASFKVETFASARDYLDHESHHGPVCLVLDVRMPGLDGFDLQKMLAGSREQIVFLTGHGDVPMCARALKAGASDFLTKPVDEVDLLSAVTRAMKRASELEVSHAERVAARELITSLTKRESEVMRLVTEGFLNKQIAADLGIAEKTVKIHRGNLMRKTQSTSVPDLMRLTLKAGASDAPSEP